MGAPTEPTLTRSPKCPIVCIEDARFKSQSDLKSEHYLGDLCKCGFAYSLPRKPLEMEALDYTFRFGKIKVVDYKIEYEESENLFSELLNFPIARREPPQ